MRIAAFFAFLLVPATAFLPRGVVGRSTGQPESRLFASAPNPIIAIAAKGMSLLSPIFKVEAALQANLLGGSQKEEAQLEIDAAKKKNKVLIYTYALSPFSTQAVDLLEGSGYQYTKIELGAEWFLLGGKGSAIRAALGNEIPSGATSLPKVFIGGKCIGGCAELSDLVSSGELEGLLKKAKALKSKK